MGMHNLMVEEASQSQGPGFAPGTNISEYWYSGISMLGLMSGRKGTGKEMA